MVKIKNFIKEKEHISSESLKDEKTDEWIRKQFQMEGEDIEKEIDEAMKNIAETEDILDNDPDLKELDPPEILFDRILAELKEKGLYEEEGEEKKEKSSNVSREEKTNREIKIVRIPIWHRLGKWVAVLAITVFGIFGMAMTSQANREYMMQQVDLFFGDNVDVKVNNTHSDELSDDEQRAVRDIEKRLKVKVPTFYYMPDNMEYNTYEIDMNLNTALVKYLYNGNTISVHIKANEEGIVGTFSFDGELISSIKSEYTDIDFDIWKIQDENDDKPGYVAQWKYKNTYYILTGKMDLVEFQKITQNISY